MVKLNTYSLTKEGGITSQDPSEMAPEWFIDAQVRWVDVMTSSTEETERLLGPLDLHERVRAAWASPDRRPEVIVLEKLLFVRLPYLGRSGEILTLHMLCGPTAIVSARTASLGEIDELATALETGARKIRTTVADLLIEILEAVFREAQQASFELRDEINDLSNRLETDAGDITIGDVLPMKRRSGELASLIEDQLICLGRLIAVRSDSLSLSAVKDDLRILIEVLEHVRPIVLRLDEQARELRQGYASLLQEASNRRLNMLAILSAIYLPSTLIAGIYGMNFEDIPITKIADGYWIVLLLMISLVAGQLAFFWWRGWFK